MKKYIALAGLLLVIGCTNDNTTRNQAVPRQERLETRADHAAPAPTVTQASSIATPGARKTSFSTKQAAAASPFEQQVLQLVNKQRTSAGLSAFNMDANLSNVARAKAQDMYNNNYFDHTSPTYGSPFDMMGKFGIAFNAAGENIAKGQPSPEQVMNDWMNSEGHKANIMSSSFTAIGIAHVKGNWVQEFTG